METLKMSEKERRRLEVMSRVRGGELKLVKAAELLGLSYRQGKRVYQRYLADGDRGLVHGLRGKASNRRADGRRRRAVALYREKYSGFGPTLAVEYLADAEQLTVAPETLRQWLLAEGLWQPQRRSKPHRRRRPRKEHRGEMLQLDGSHHDWFEGRRAWAVLMVAIDDATGEVFARFFEEETTEAAMRTFRRYLERHGIPQALYVDRDSIYRSDREATADEILRGEEPCTQFGRAMRQLGVRLIMAHSPQAKGRVERSNRTLQDRLVKALRLQSINDVATANEFLEEGFLAAFNARFAVKPVSPADVHRQAPEDLDLALVFSTCEDRVVQNDWTIRWRNRWLQLTSAHRGLRLPGRRVTVCEPLDAPLCLLYDGRRLEFSELAEPPPKRRAVQRQAPTGSSQGQRPAANHPWRGRVVPAASAGGAACSAPAR